MLGTHAVFKRTFDRVATLSSFPCESDVLWGKRRIWPDGPTKDAVNLVGAGAAVAHWQNPSPPVTELGGRNLARDRSKIARLWKWQKHLLCSSFWLASIQEELRLSVVVMLHEEGS